MSGARGAVSDEVQCCFRGCHSRDILLFSQLGALINHHVAYSVRLVENIACR